MATKPLDLNRLRDTLLDSQRQKEPNPTTPNKTVVVDRDANIRFGDEIGRGEQTTTVEQAPWACGGAA
jgi:hypothetical protein